MIVSRGRRDVKDKKRQQKPRERGPGLLRERRLNEKTTFVSRGTMKQEVERINNEKQGSKGGKCVCLLTTLIRSDTVRFAVLVGVRHYDLLAFLRHPSIYSVGLLIK